MTGKQLPDDVPEPDAKRMGEFLKVLGNAAVYGIFAEMNRNEECGRTEVKVHGLSPFATAIDAPEDPGEYCFPPIAACITGGARLLLAMLERCVTDAGGHYAMCDTDSMAIVASTTGGSTHVPNASENPEIRVLSLAEVEAIQRRFDALHPYDRTKVSGHLLEIEKEQRDPEGNRLDLYCYAISAKRYALMTRQECRFELVDRSEHGLGHLLDPK